MRSEYKGFIYNSDSFHLALVLDRMIRKRKPKNAKGYYMELSMNYEPVGFHGRYRTLGRVMAVRKDVVSVVLPGWNPRLAVSVRKNQFPPGWLEKMDKGSRFFCDVNLSVSDAKDLGPSNFKSLATSKQVDKICSKPLAGAR